MTRGFSSAEMCRVEFFRAKKIDPILGKSLRTLIEDGDSGSYASARPISSINPGAPSRSSLDALEHCVFMNDDTE